MKTHRRFALAAAIGALASAATAAAQPSEPYEYAEQADEATVIYRDDPVIQPVPAPLPPPVSAPVLAPPPLPPIAHPPVHHAVPGYPVHAPPPPPMAHARVPPFDREAWLRHCRERIRGLRPADRASVIGGLLGAGVGGVIGNRAFDSERLGGTLLGAGIGGLAGLAIGAAIGAASERRREDECAWHLDRYMAGGHPGQGHGYPGHYPGYYAGYHYGYPAIAYVPVLVAVPQRAVVRETVTEEWSDVPVRRRSIIRERAPAAPPPSGDKRTKIRPSR